MKTKPAKNAASTMVDDEDVDGVIIPDLDEKYTRTHKHLSYASLTIISENNHRWGSDEARDADLRATRVMEDGERECPYNLIRESIRTTGIQTPIGVVAEGGKYRVIFGFTRATAAVELHLANVPAWVYSGLTPEMELSLQLTENAEGIRRAPSWGRQTAAYAKLYNTTYAKLKTAPEEVLIRHSPTEGENKGPSITAWNIIGKRIGLFWATVRDHVGFYESLDPRVQALANDGVIAYCAAKEFVCKADPYSAEFIGLVLDEIKRCSPNATKLTSNAVRDARTRVSEWVKAGRGADGSPIWRGVKLKDVKIHGERDNNARPAAFIPADASRLSPGKARDISINIAAAVIAARKLSISSTSEEWTQAQRDPAWYRIAGIGLGAGDVVCPSDLDSENAVDVPPMAEREFGYVAAAFAAAAMRNEIVKRARRPFSEWIAAAGKRPHRAAFRSAISDACNKAKRANLADVVTAAWQVLCDTIPPAGWSVACTETARIKK